VQDVVDRLPHLRSKDANLKQQMQDSLSEHKWCIDKHGKDLPQIRNWKQSKKLLMSASSKFVRPDASKVANTKTPSAGTLHGLDWLNFFLADVQSGVGPFLAI
jgi:hypothetical protein